jgi:phosphoribosylglycinamide formyltransferase-1
MKIAIFASHDGSDAQAIIDGCSNKKIKAKVAVVISNNSDANVLNRAKKAGIPSYHISSKDFETEEEFSNNILSILTKYKIDIIFLAGYMKLLSASILEKYNNRVFNIHPALLPKYGGKGMYGINVHKAVIENKEKETGVTIHRVNQEYDKGEIIAQVKVPVRKDDTPEILRDRVLEKEHEFLVEVVGDIALKKYKLD